MKLAPWVESRSDVWERFADPHDGRTWSLDGSPRWLAQVCLCCRNSGHPHWVWTLSDKPYSGGSEPTKELAFEAANEALKERGFE